MANWFYYNENGEKISVTGKELKELAKNGTITPETFVETAEGKTGLAKHVKGLPFFETSKPETIPLATDTPSASIDSDAFGAAINAAMSNITSSPSPTKPLKSDDDIYQFLSNESTSAKPLPVSYPTESYTFTAREQAEIDKFCTKYAQYRGDVRAVDEKGHTLLHNAMREDVAVAKFLVSKGAVVEAKNIVGRTALHCAAIHENIAVAKFLVSVGADVNARSTSGGGDTPLHMAKDIKIVKFLVSKGADVNAKENDGTTPLHHTARYNLNVDVAKFLVSKGADVNAKDNTGRTPLDRAKEGGEPDMIRYLSNPSASSSTSTASSFSASSFAASGYSGTSQSSWASEGIGWGVAIGIAVIALLVALANQSSLAAWADMSKESAPIVILCFGGFIILLLSLIWGGTRSASKCPSCERAWAKETVNTSVLDSRHEIRDDVKYVNHFNSRGEITGTTAIPTQKIVTVKTCLDEYRCKHCGHEWSKTYNTES